MRRLALHPGDAAEERFPAAADLSVSRRGVVDVYHLGDGRWQLTALRSGIVVIEARAKGDDGGLVGRLVVEVAPADDDGRSTRSDGVRTGYGIPRWICAPEGIACDEDAGLVSGATDDFRWLRRAQQACARTRGCAIEVEPSAAARSAWADELRGALGSAFDVEPAAGSRFVAAALCGEQGRGRAAELADDLSGGAVGDGTLVVRCREELKGMRYKLSARIFLVESGAASQLGFDGQVDAAVGAGAGAGAGAGSGRATFAAASVLSRLRALERERRAEMLGEPVVRMAANEPVRLMSGGEFQVVDYAPGEAGAPRASWKRHGLEMALTATPLADGGARLKYELSLSARSSGTAAALAVNSVASSVDLALGAPHVAALLDLKAEGQSSGITPVLAGLPIVGPLFRMAASESSSSRLVAWLELTADDGTERLK